jgi:hypothetical protein
MNLKDAELKAMLPPSTKWSDVESAVDDQFADFQRSMPADEGAVRTVNAVRDSAIRLSVKYMNEGAGRGDAVKKAYRDLIESQYSLVEFRGSTLRVPANLDSDEIEVGARYAIEHIEPPAASLVAPTGGAMTSEEYAGAWTQYVRENGYWVTRPDGLGARLYVDGGPIATDEGPVERTWQELQALVSDAELERIRSVERIERIERARE